jgi:hypothetical protein
MARGTLITATVPSARSMQRSTQPEAATKRRFAAFAVALAGSAAAGLIAGLIWAALAPRPLLQEVASGEAKLVNAETSAYIVADAWFCLIAAVGGLITGVLGYRLLIRRTGWGATAGLILGSVAAALLAVWAGENMGLSGYNHVLATASVGTFFPGSLGLGAKSALAFWPLVTSVVILVGESGGRRQATAEAQ